MDKAEFRPLLRERESFSRVRRPSFLPSFLGAVSLESLVCLLLEVGSLYSITRRTEVFFFFFFLLVLQRRREGNDILKQNQINICKREFVRPRPRCLRGCRQKFITRNPGLGSILRFVFLRSVGRSAAAAAATNKRRQAGNG